VTDFERIAGDVVAEAPELRGDLVYAIGCALDLRGWDDGVDDARYERLERLSDALGDVETIEASLDELLIRRAARAARVAAPTAAAVRASIEEPTMWGEGE
jgi:hypothetical protein